ncbi:MULTISPECIES: Imm26 family immunity protein [Niastella]|uniref:DUF402 domain-containing protein n=1 Tax=Niastella soli TaxID=2821487 RepID=A0ABS3Z515_9BACT|nr:Imm26 family immunity protein [Niastella soli]MBO9205247.1 hypothetical protein [Niastella soli]
MAVKLKVGDLIKIPFKEGWHTYGRVLIDESFAFYDCPSKDERIDYDNIIKCDILFTAHVNFSTIKSGYWTKILNIPLEGKLENFYPRYFTPSPTSVENLNFYEVYKEEIEDAIKKDWIKTGKIQLAGTHDRIHVESRINDYYNGVRNVHNERLIALFKKMFGLG